MGFEVPIGLHSVLEKTSDIFVVATGIWRNDTDDSRC